MENVKKFVCSQEHREGASTDLFSSIYCWVLITNRYQLHNVSIYKTLSSVTTVKREFTAAIVPLHKLSTFREVDIEQLLTELFTLRWIVTLAYTKTVNQWSKKLQSLYFYAVFWNFVLWGKVRWGKVRYGMVWYGKVRRGEERYGNVRSGQIKWKKAIEHWSKDARRETAEVR